MTDDGRNAATMPLPDYPSIDHAVAVRTPLAACTECRRVLRHGYGVCGRCRYRQRTPAERAAIIGRAIARRRHHT